MSFREWVAALGLIWTSSIGSLDAAPATPLQPIDLDGLEAWYRVDSLHRNHSDGDVISGWKDSSGNGHHLQDERNGVRPIFKTQELNDKPAVLIRKGDSFRVFNPFELDDHTIFLVYRADYGSRALFTSDEDDTFGVILADDRQYHKYQNGKDFLVNYNEPVRMGQDYSVTVLAREAGLLASWINGRDVSSGSRFSDVVRVGRFFVLKHTQFARSDGDGLRLVEMIFYKRYLPDDERAGVTLYLADRYGIEVDLAAEPAEPEPEPEPQAPERTPETMQVWLSSRLDVDLNVPVIAVPWDVQSKIEGPFRHDPKEASTRLYCTRDATTVQLYVRAPLTTKNAGTALRLLLLKNGAEYLPEQVSSGAIAGAGGEPTRTVELEATLQLDDGDWIEIVATGMGDEGKVNLVAGAAVLAATVKAE